MTEVEALPGRLSIPDLLEPEPCFESVAADFGQRRNRRRPTSLSFYRFASAADKSCPHAITNILWVNHHSVPIQADLLPDGFG